MNERLSHGGFPGVPRSYFEDIPTGILVGAKVECELCGGAGWTWLPYLGVVPCRCRQREVRA